MNRLRAVSLLRRVVLQHGADEFWVFRTQAAWHCLQRASMVCMQDHGSLRQTEWVHQQLRHLSQDMHASA